MKKAFYISLGAHLAVMVLLYLLGWTRTSVISIPMVHQVQIITMPEMPAPPPDDPAPELEPETETIPPPPEEKKQLKPKLKEAKPKPKPAQQSEDVRQSLTQNEGLAGMRSDELFEYPYYLRLMVDKVSRNWRNPYAGQDEVVLCTVFFRIQRDGSIADERVEKSSGSASFDRAALRAVIMSSPLPPLPPDFRENRLTVHLDFEYRKN